MIQRKQSLFLLFSAIIMVGYLFAPVVRIVGGPVKTNILGHDMAVNVNFPVIGRYFVFICMIPALITVGLNLLTIFLYQYRRTQIWLSWLSIIPCVFCFCYVYYRMANTDMIQDQIFYYGNISPIVAIIFIFLAILSIQRDEELVKSVDRLR